MHVVCCLFCKKNARSNKYLLSNITYLKTQTKMIYIYFVKKPDRTGFRAGQLPRGPPQPGDLDICLVTFYFMVF